MSGMVTGRREEQDGEHHVDFTIIIIHDKDMKHQQESPQTS